MELVRLAIPRRVYTQSHIDYVAEVLLEINENKKKLKGFKIIEEPKFLRHFTAKFSPYNLKNDNIKSPKFSKDIQQTHGC